MVETAWETTIDSMVKKNVKVVYDVFNNSDPSRLFLASPPFVPNVRYLLRVRVKNVGTEVLFNHIEARVLSKPGIQLFSNTNYSDVIPRKHLQYHFIQPNGAGTAEDIPMKVTSIRRLRHEIIKVGLYAEVAPVGHTWKTLKGSDWSTFK